MHLLVCTMVRSAGHRQGTADRLSTVFLRAAGHGQEAHRPGANALQRQLEAIVTSARDSWPSVRIPDHAFVRHLGERMLGEPPEALPEALSTLHVEDLYLACACARGDARAIAEFESLFCGTIRDAAWRIDPSLDFVLEVQQILRCRLFVSEQDTPARIGTYRGTGRLRSWVQVSATRAALELRRRRRPEIPSEDDALASAAEWDDDAELGCVRMVYRHEFTAAFKRALCELQSRQRNVLRLYVLDGLNIDQIGALYGVHRATVARWIGRSRDELLSRTRQQLMQTLDITEAEFQSLVGVVRSHVDLSLERFLREQK